ncbi:MAG TPA: PQQ-dependent sugar dehydrogenase [Desulfuromonadaceae bacterium]|nr:PQQ-dependent sugar dehydrogenase [Desulfuromonadaceae bacterium]
MPANPPTVGYTHKNAFGSLTFDNPIAIVTPPGETNRVFILQKNGVIIVITNLASPTKTTFMDIASKVTFSDSNTGGSGEQGLLGLAFHPGYKTNRFFYVFYTGQSSEGTSGLHDIVERYQTSSSNPNSGVTSTATKIISQYDRDVNHNAGDIHFGSDGYLYIAVGDEGAEHDGRIDAQQIAKNLFSGILRIDVDKKAGNLTPNPSPTASPTGNYLIPSDNPWIGITHFDDYNVTPSQVRTEFYAVGLRNPFRFSFDPLNGNMWVGEVGQDAVEEINVVRKGGNYGWAWWEGNTSPPANMTTSGRPQPTNPIKPIIAYNHGSSSTQGNCVIGGVVYRGTKLAQLYGKYIFADYVTGNFWIIDASKTNGTISTPSPIFSDSSLHPTAFGVDPRQGDVLFTAEHTTGTPTSATIERLVYNTTTNGAALPATLFDTGAFNNLMSLSSPLSPLTPNAGIVDYDINVPFWSDNAIKSRWFSIPNTSLDMTFNATNNWLFPTGTVWIKHFNLELTNGVASSQIRLETRLLVKNSSGIYGVTYRWGGNRTNATLVAEGGMDESFVIHDSSGGILRTQVWHYPSRNECTQCHTPEGGFGLGMRTEQFNKDHTYAGGTDNEIQALSDAGYFTSAVTDTSTLMALAPASDNSSSLELRSRSFLMANCSQCHQPGGSAVLANWDARIQTPITQQGIINGSLQDNLGDTANKVVVPNDLSHSVLFKRASTRGAGSIQMPPLDSNLVDVEATNLLASWINSMDSFWLGVTPYGKTITAGGSSTTFTITSLKDTGFSGSVTLSATGAPAGVTVSFSPSSITPNAGSTMTVSASSAAVAGTYTINVVGTSGSSTYTTPFVIRVTGGSGGGLPAPWTDTDIGAVGVAGSATFSGSTFTINGSGSDIWATGDLFNFVSQPVSGDVTIVARVATEESTAAWAKVGVMIRESTAANAAYAGVYLTPSNGVSMQVRTGTGVTSVDLGRQAGPTDPYWVKLVRSGNTFTGFSSPDGSTWTQVASTNITMGASVLAGMPVCAHDNTTLNTSTFDNVSVSTGPTADFSLSASPSSVTVTTGGTGSTTITETDLNGYNGTVDLSATGLPSGVSATFVPASTTNNSTLTFTASSSAATGTFTVTVHGTDGTLNHTTPVTLTVNAAPDFSIAASPSSLAVDQGGTDDTIVTETDLNGFSGTVSFSASGLPAGVTATFVPTSTTSNTTLTVAADGTAVPGPYTFTVTGTSGTLAHSIQVPLTINSTNVGDSTLYEAENLPATTNGAALNVVADSLASGGFWVSLLSTNNGPWVEYTLTNVSAGTYSLGFLYKQHPNRGIHSLTVDGVKMDGDLNQYSNVVAYPEKNFGVITFTADGDHKVRLTATGKDPAAGTPNISADAFRLTTTNEVWLSQDIGAVGIAGSFTDNGDGSFVLAGSGSDIWTTGDQFRYAYQYASGDIDFAAQVTSETVTTSPFAKAGVMIRESLATNSINACVLLTPTNGVALQVRTATGASSINVTGWVKGPQPPYWVRIVRSGSTFTGFTSPDGSSWTQLGQTNVTMHAGVLAGMAVTSHNNAAVNTATFQ